MDNDKRGGQDTTGNVGLSHQTSLICMNVIMIWT